MHDAWCVINKPSNKNILTVRWSNRQIIKDEGKRPVLLLPPAVNIVIPWLSPRQIKDSMEEHIISTSLSKLVMPWIRLLHNWERGPKRIRSSPGWGVKRCPPDSPLTQDSEYSYTPIKFHHVALHIALWSLLLATGISIQANHKDERYKRAQKNTEGLAESKTNHWSTHCFGLILFESKWSPTCPRRQPYRQRSLVSTLTDVKEYETLYHIALQGLMLWQCIKSDCKSNFKPNVIY